MQLVHDTTHPFLSTLVHALTYSLTYGAAALLLRRLNVDPGLRRLRDVGWFMFVGAVAAPLAASLMSVTNFTVSGSATLAEWSLLVPQYAAGDATGVGPLAPFMLVLLRYLPLPKPSPPDLRPALNGAKGDVREVWRRPTLREAATILFFAACLASAAFLAYVVPQDLTLNHSYITFFPLLLIAGWYGFA